MRAKTIWRLPLNDNGQYSTPCEIMSWLRFLGWEEADICKDPDDAPVPASVLVPDTVQALLKSSVPVPSETAAGLAMAVGVSQASFEDRIQHRAETMTAAQKRRMQYMERASLLFNHLPEMAAKERENVIFYGRLPSEQADLVVTRPTDGQVVFRIVQPSLGNLITATEYLVKQLLDVRIGGKALKLEASRVQVYEQGNDHIIIHGKVTPDPLREAFRHNRKDGLILAAGVCLSLALFASVIALRLVSAAIAMDFTHFALAIAPAVIASMVVAGTGFFGAYTQIRRNNLIAWGVAATDQDR